MVVVLTNTGTSACRTVGYPTAWYLDAGGNRISSTSIHESAPPPSPVQLLPHAEASTTVWSDDPAVPTPPCPVRTTAGLRIIPPGQTGSLVAPVAIPVCPMPNVVGVTPLVNGSAQSGL